MKKQANVWFNCPLRQMFKIMQVRAWRVLADAGRVRSEAKLIRSVNVAQQASLLKRAVSIEGTIRKLCERLEAVIKNRNTIAGKEDLKIINNTLDNQQEEIQKLRQQVNLLKI